jgi:hypothetical protein
VSSRLSGGTRHNVIAAITVMANLYYSDRLIIAHASLNRSDNTWSAGAEITWKQNDQRHSHTISGLADRFKTAEDAERFVVTLAKAWIDANQ